MTERLRRPRKSILSRPRSSTPCISYWVTMGASSGLLLSGLRWMGTYSVSGWSVMTTAAAWIPSPRRRPSSPLATSMTRLASGSVSYMVRSSPASCEPVLEAFRLGQAGGQRGVAAHQQRGHGLGDLVAHDVRVAEHPRRVAHGGPGLDGGEGDDLGHVVRAVALGGVLDHVAAVALVEVHVDVGHLDAARVEEALEEQVVADRVEVDDLEAVGDAAAGGRAAARADPDALGAGEADQVPHHEEVGREPHVGDDVELVVEALHDLGRDGHPVALLRPLDAEVAEVGGGPDLVGVAGELVGHGELGQARLAEVDLDVGPLGDQQRVVARLGQLGEEVPHLGGRLQVVLLALELEPLGVVDEGAGLHAQQGVVGDVVLAVGVVAVVGGEQRGADAVGDLDQGGVGLVLLGQAVVLDLDEEVALAEDVLEAAGQHLGLDLVVGQQRLEDDAAEAARWWR